ncbi:MAG: isoamylase early set domain-containing protein [Gemmatirosa sp.]
MSTTPHDGRPTLDPDEAHQVAGLAPVVGVLRGLPPVPPGAVDRVVAAAVARGHRPGEPAARRGRGLGGFGGGWRVAAGLVLAVGLGTAALATARHREATTTTLAVTPTAAAPAVLPGDPDGPVDFLPATTGADTDAPLPVAFLLRRPDAARVSLVGDFNGWDPHATPLARSEDGTWTATVPLAPGRHAYAYVVNDSSWITDPRVPVTRDADYGRDHSVGVGGAP